MVCTRRSRSNATEKNEVVDSPKKRPPTKMKTYLKRHKKQKQQMQLHQENEQGPLIVTPPPPPPPTEEEHQHQEEDSLATHPPPGHEKEAQVENVGGEGVVPLDISSDEEDRKPQVDYLSMLKSVSKPTSKFETSQKNLDILKGAAVVFKAELVSHLEKTAHKLDFVDMVRRANKCFVGLKSLKVDYEAFQGEVRKLIKYFLELKEVEEKNTCTDLGLKVAYEKSVSDANGAREELTNAQYNLINAQTSYKLTIEKIEKLVALTHRLEEEADIERDKIENLTSTRDHCDEALSIAEKSKERYEGIQSSLTRLRELV